MEKEYPRLLIQHVIMNCDYLDAAFSKRLDYRIDFLCGHHHITRYMGLFIGSYESGPRVEPHAGGYFDPMHFDSWADPR